jgi:hypothetical protein
MIIKYFGQFLRVLGSEVCTRAVMLILPGVTARRASSSQSYQRLSALADEVGVYGVSSSSLERSLDFFLDSSLFLHMHLRCDGAVRYSMYVSMYDTL